MKLTKEEIDELQKSFAPTSYALLSRQVIENAYSEFLDFVGRCTSDPNVQDEAKTCLWEYCAHTREIFLQMIVLGNLERLLPDINITIQLRESLASLRLRLRKLAYEFFPALLSTGTPKANIMASVDVLILKTYIQLPNMLEQLVTQHGKPIIVPTLTKDERMVIEERLNDEFLVMYSNSSIPKTSLLKFLVDKGRIIIEKTFNFCLNIISDFSKWQILDARITLPISYGYSVSEEQNYAFKDILQTKILILQRNQTKVVHNSNEDINIEDINDNDREKSDNYTYNVRSKTEVDVLGEIYHTASRVVNEILLQMLEEQALLCLKKESLGGIYHYTDGSYTIDGKIYKFLDIYIMQSVDIFFGGAVEDLKLGQNCLLGSQTPNTITSQLKSLSNYSIILRFLIRPNGEICCILWPFNLLAKKQGDDTSSPISKALNIIKSLDSWKFISNWGKIEYATADLSVILLHAVNILRYFQFEVYRNLIHELLASDGNIYYDEYKMVLNIYNNTMVYHIWMDIFNGSLIIDLNTSQTVWKLYPQSIFHSLALSIKVNSASLIDLLPYIMYMAKFQNIYKEIVNTFNWKILRNPPNSILSLVVSGNEDIDNHSTRKLILSGNSSVLLNTAIDNISLIFGGFIKGNRFKFDLNNPEFHFLFNISQKSSAEIVYFSLNVIGYKLNNFKVIFFNCFCNTFNSYSWYKIFYNDLANNLDNNSNILAIFNFDLSTESSSITSIETQNKHIILKLDELYNKTFLRNNVGIIRLIKELQLQDQCFFPFIISKQFNCNSNNLEDNEKIYELTCTLAPGKKSGPQFRLLLSNKNNEEGCLDNEVNLKMNTNTCFYSSEVRNNRLESLTNSNYGYTFVCELNQELGDSCINPMLFMNGKLPTFFLLYEESINNASNLVFKKIIENVEISIYSKKLDTSFPEPNWVVANSIKMYINNMNNFFKLLDLWNQILLIINYQLEIIYLKFYSCIYIKPNLEEVKSDTIFLDKLYSRKDMIIKSCLPWDIKIELKPWPMLFGGKLLKNLLFNEKYCGSNLSIKWNYNGDNNSKILDITLKDSLIDPYIETLYNKHLEENIESIDFFFNQGYKSKESAYKYTYSTYILDTTSFGWSLWRLINTYELGLLASRFPLLDQDINSKSIFNDPNGIYECLNTIAFNKIESIDKIYMTFRLRPLGMHMTFSLSLSSYSPYKALIEFVDAKSLQIDGTFINQPIDLVNHFAELIRKFSQIVSCQTLDLEYKNLSSKLLSNPRIYFIHKYRSELFKKIEKHGEFYYYPGYIFDNILCPLSQYLTCSFYVSISSGITQKITNSFPLPNEPSSLQWLIKSNSYAPHNLANSVVKTTSTTLPSLSTQNKIQLSPNFNASSNLLSFPVKLSLLELTWYYQKTTSFDVDRRHNLFFQILWEYPQFKIIVDKDVRYKNSYGWPDLVSKPSLSSNPNTDLLNWNIEYDIPIAFMQESSKFIDRLFYVSSLKELNPSYIEYLGQKRIREVFLEADYNKDIKRIKYDNEFISNSCNGEDDSEVHSTNNKDYELDNKKETRFLSNDTLLVPLVCFPEYIINKFDNYIEISPMKLRFCLELCTSPISSELDIMGHTLQLMAHLRSSRILIRVIITALCSSLLVIRDISTLLQYPLLSYEGKYPLYIQAICQHDDLLVPIRQSNTVTYCLRGFLFRIWPSKVVFGLNTTYCDIYIALRNVPVQSIDDVLINGTNASNILKNISKQAHRSALSVVLEYLFRFSFEQLKCLHSPNPIQLLEIPKSLPSNSLPDNHINSIYQKQVFEKIGNQKVATHQQNSRQPSNSYTINQQINSLNKSQKVYHSHNHQQTYFSTNDQLYNNSSQSVATNQTNQVQSYNQYQYHLKQQAISSPHLHMNYTQNQSQILCNQQHVQVNHSYQHQQSQYQKQQTQEYSIIHDQSNFKQYPKNLQSYNPHYPQNNHLYNQSHIYQQCQTNHQSQQYTHSNQQTQPNHLSHSQSSQLSQSYNQTNSHSHLIAQSNHHPQPHEQQSYNHQLYNQKRQHSHTNYEHFPLIQQPNNLSYPNNLPSFIKSNYQSQVRNISNYPVININNAQLQSKKSHPKDSPNIYLANSTVYNQNACSDAIYKIPQNQSNMQYTQQYPIYYPQHYSQHIQHQSQQYNTPQYLQSSTQTQSVNSQDGHESNAK
ncbi:uncharacterized protein CMU_025270 [Cryptosporidium muris RN66]|uniref:Mediator of RNA polymerase II transcription subunit 14 n=1 Tax=Cryptosporidium muris (strain RN66) TaxID=441375 RepID=B6AAW9_CRYMR|nr:uncharacterized protein CMU_025270 [Cryptosporidium muris RN66]EEA05521.1 hypothetical protein, conserved [Cryptosporidium muris RN66]|eukprot:XP_002139870.1 hypothetical protein [Cryptosporidium muris RN66]